MAELTVGLSGGGRQVLPGHPLMTVLNHLLAAGLAIPHDCGGHARCGTCRVRIVAGAAGLRPLEPGPEEAARLLAIAAGPGERLACQVRFIRDLEIEIVGRT